MQVERRQIKVMLVEDHNLVRAGIRAVIDGQSDIQVIAEGVGPQDGFSEYNSLANSGVARPRWGDYGASVATGDNTIWVAAEWIAQSCTLQQYYPVPTTDINVFASEGFGSCGGTRVTLGNWATRISQLDVSP